MFSFPREPKRVAKISIVKLHEKREKRRKFPTSIFTFSFRARSSEAEADEEEEASGAFGQCKHKHEVGMGKTSSRYKKSLV